MAGRRAAGATPATAALTRAGVRVHRARLRPRPGRGVVRAGGGGRARPGSRAGPQDADGRRSTAAWWSASCRCPGSSTSRRWPRPSAASGPRWPTPPPRSGPPGTSSAASPRSASAGRTRTVLDESALSYDTVYVSGGRRGLDLGLSPGTWCGSPAPSSPPSVEPADPVCRSLASASYVYRSTLIGVHGLAPAAGPQLGADMACDGQLTLRRRPPTCFHRGLPPVER